MPYSQLNQMAKGKFESTQPKTNNCSADLAFMPDNEFVELVWEKGQILTQGQSSRSRKIPSSTIFPAHTSKAQEKDEGEVVIPKIGRLGTMEYILNNFSSPGPSGHMGMGQDDDIMVPWLNYPLDDSIQHDYCSEFFPELSGANLNAFSAQNNGLQIYKNSIKDFHMASGHGGKSPEKENASKIIGGSLEPSRPSSSQLCSSSLQQFQTSVPSHRSRVSDFITSDNNNTQRGNSTPIPTPIGDLPNAKLHKQDPGPTRPLQQPCENTELINFSHFSRPAALVKANLQSIGAIASPGLLNIDKLRSNEKGSAAGISNPFESTLIESSCGSRSAADFQGQLSSVPTKMDLKSSMSKPPKEASAEQSEVICREDALRNNISPDQVLGRTSSFAASTAIGRPDGEKVVEPVVASSSVCSGNSAGGASSDPKYNGKRKSQDAEESEYQSEDVEEESVGVRKPAPARGGTGAKRSRAAEVHNLSERRRRDRINEKMRALQELIPNCNKVDKASMLDEAIEYLKALQRQVQIMSMGSGLCMPPMILQTGMQQIQAAPHMAHFSPMGVGMGMGMGFGMGLFDMSSYSTGCPLIQMPPMHGPHFRCPPMSGPTGLPGMARSSLQMFGFPGQGLPLSMPQAPFTRLSGGPFTTTVSTSDVSGVAAPMEVSDSAPQSSTKDHSQLTHKTIVACLQTQKSTQCQATGGFEQSPIVQRNDQTPHVSGN